MADTLDEMNSTGSTRRTCRVMSRRDEPSGIWALLEIKEEAEDIHLDRGP